MLPRADLNSNARPTASIEAPTPVGSSTDARQEIYHRLTQVAIGKQLQAEVLSVFDDGTFLVNVSDTPARMALPNGTRVGDRIPMVLVAREPRPTFLISTQEGSAPASLSTTGRLIDQALQIAQKQGTPTAIVDKVPLLASPTAMNPEKLASALHDTLEFSGVFYESHLQEWASGQRALPALQREPQAQGGTYIQHDNAAAGMAGAAGGELARVSRDMHDVADGAQKLVELIRDLRQQPGYPATMDIDVLVQSGSAPPPGIEPEAARTISLQLNALEQRQVQWQGNLWPGQRLDWTVREDKRQGGPRDTPESSWSSVVKFRLPSLGDISATVQLVGNRVHVSINTTDETTARSLRQFGPALADALAVAGSPLDSLLVSKDEPA
jgi:Flagellar hook-length control protein FliK